MFALIYEYKSAHSGLIVITFLKMMKILLSCSSKNESRLEAQCLKIAVNIDMCIVLKYITKVIKQFINDLL